MHKHKREHIMHTFKQSTTQNVSKYTSYTHSSKAQLNNVTHHTHIQAKHNSTTYLNTHHDIIYEISFMKYHLRIPFIQRSLSGARSVKLSASLIIIMHPSQSSSNTIRNANLDHVTFAEYLLPIQPQ